MHYSIASCGLQQALCQRGALVSRQQGPSLARDSSGSNDNEKRKRTRPDTTGQSARQIQKCDRDGEQAERFICNACQNKTLSKRVGVMGGMGLHGSGTHHLTSYGAQQQMETPSRSRLGRPRTNINYANFA